jgi:hypothetical protein
MTMKIAAGLGALALCIAVPAQARMGAHPPATPTLAGNWTANFTMTLESTPQTPNLVVPEAEAKRLAPILGAAFAAFFKAGLDPEVPMLVEQSDGLPIVRGQRRTRIVVEPADGKMPYTPAAQKILHSPPPPEKLDNPEDRPNAERCLAANGQPPLASIVFGSDLQILTFPDKVLIHTEYGDEIRVIPITDKHAPRLLWTTMGDSIGHWEGSTLVVETIGQPDGDSFRIGPVMLVPGEATVIERLTPVSNRELLYQFTVIDPKTYAAPWKAEFSWYRTDKLMYEHACHEGNYSLPNILAGARHEEAVAHAAAASR